MNSPKRLYGPRFEVRTWREAVPGHVAPMWFASIVRLRPERPTFIQSLAGKTPPEKLMATLDAGLSCSDAQPTMVSAVTDAMEEWRERFGGDD